MPSVADYIIRLSVDGTKASVGLAKVSRQIDGMVASFGRFALGFIGVQAIRDTIEKAANIGRMAERLNLGTETLQKFGYAAERAGINLEEVARAFNGLRAAQYNALRDPNGEDAGLFRQIGISQDDLKTASTEQLFDKIGRVVASSHGQLAAMAPAMRLLKDEGGQMTSALANGFAAAAREAGNVGAVIEDDVIVRLRTASDEMNALTNSLTVSMAGPIAGAMTLLGRFITVMKMGVLDIKDAVGEKMVLHGFKTQEEFVRERAQREAEMARDYAAFFQPPPVQLDPSKRRPVGDVASREKEKTEKVKAANYRRNDVDSLAKVGTYIGYAQYSAPMLDVLRNQLRAQLEIARNTRRGSGSTPVEW